MQQDFKKKNSQVVSSTTDVENQEKGYQFKLNINQNFQRKFEEKKKREELDRAKAQLGNDFDKIVNHREGHQQDNYSESSPMEEEDEFGELINDEFQDQFLLTLAQIRNKDPEIYTKEKKFFVDDDMGEKEDDNGDQKAKKQKLTIKEFVRQEVRDKIRNEEEGGNAEEDQEDDDRAQWQKKVGETPVETERRLKNEFKAAAQNSLFDDSDGENGNDDFIKIKQKSTREVEDEENEYKDYVQSHPKKEQQVLEQFWGNQKELDETDQFLKKFIMTKGWIDRDDYKNDPQNKQNAQQSSGHQSEAEQFEEKYNFRFEEPGGTQIASFSRNIQDTLRVKDDHRKQKRKEQAQRIQKERVQREQELKRLKNLKKEEIFGQLEKIQNVAGSQKIDQKIFDLIEKDYDPQEFNRQIQQEFDESYYDQEDPNPDELQAFEKQYMEGFQEQKKDDQEGNQRAAHEDQNNVLDIRANIPIAHQQNLSNRQIQIITSQKNSKMGQQGEEDDQDEDDDEAINIWWYCDHCLAGIQQNEFKYESTVVDDYTLCKKCFEANIHEHQMKKSIVPKGCKPPSDQRILKLIQNIKMCKKCLVKMNQENDYYVLNSNEDYILCEDCFAQENEKLQDEYTLVEATEVDLQKIAQQDPTDLTNYVEDDQIQKLIDQYYLLDYEDVIGDGIKTRFKYVDVPAESYGLNDDQLIYADTKSLNKYVGLQYLAPYRDDQGMISSRKLRDKAKLNEVIRSTKKIKQEVQLAVQINKQQEEESQNHKNKKKVNFLKNKLQKIQKHRLFQTEKEIRAQQKQKDKPLVKLQNLSIETPKLKLSESRLKSYGLGTSSDT